MLPFKSLFHFFSFIGLPCKWAARSFLGRKKKALLLKLVDGLVLDLDNAFILLSQAVSAAKTIRGEGKREGETQISVTPSNSRHSLKFGYDSFLRSAILKIKIQNQKHC